MSDDFTITGLDEMVRRLESIGSNLPAVSARPLKREAETIMTESKRNYVPVGKTGNLRASGYVGEPVVSGQEVSVEMGYGGNASAYALAVHEHLSAHSPASWKKAKAVHFRQGGSKFLELPLMKAIKGMDERLAKGIMDEMERLVRQL